MTRWRGLLAALAVTMAVPAQEKLEVTGPSPGTVRLGDAATVSVRIEGRGADPRTPKLPEVAGMTLQLGSPTSTSHTYFDGRTMVQRQAVQYQLRLLPQREGEFVVPPFPIWTGTREQMTPELRLNVVRDLRGEELGWLDAEIEPRRVYVHEPVRIRVEFGIQPGLRIVEDVYQRTRYFDVEVQATWLSAFPGGERMTLPDPTGDLRVIIITRFVNAK